MLFRSVRQVAEWVNAVEDNDRLPFVLIDKVAARVYVFSRTGELKGNAAALLGSARGDATAAGIGSLPLSAIRPEHRTTPAGRFVAHLDTDLRGRNVLVIDHDASIALHPVVRGTPEERRAERLVVVGEEGREGGAEPVGRSHGEAGRRESKQQRTAARTAPLAQLRHRPAS